MLIITADYIFLKMPAILKAQLLIKKNEIFKYILFT